MAALSPTPQRASAACALAPSTRQVTERSPEVTVIEAPEFAEIVPVIVCTRGPAESAAGTRTSASRIGSRSRMRVFVGLGDGTGDPSKELASVSARSGPTRRTRGSASTGTSR